MESKPDPGNRKELFISCNFIGFDPSCMSNIPLKTCQVTNSNTFPPPVFLELSNCLRWCGGEAVVAPNKLRFGHKILEIAARNRTPWVFLAPIAIAGWWLSLPLWKIWVSWDYDIPNIWKNKSHVPKHQPDRVFRDYTELYLSSWAETKKYNLGHHLLDIGG